MNQFAEIDLIKARSLVASKELEIAKANREQALGGWLSDHEKICQEIDADIEYHLNKALQNAT